MGRAHGFRQLVRRNFRNVVELSPIFDLYRLTVLSTEHR